MKQPTAPTTTTPARPQPERSTGCTPEVRDLLCAIIRAKGLSDSAAAREACVSTSSLSRWKQENPSLRLLLRHAREEFRMARLDTILQAAGAEGGRGWRAAAWLLIHIFPEDYSPKAAEREKFQQLALAREQEEEAAALQDASALPEPVSERSADAFPEAQTPRVAFESDSQNSQNSRPAPLAGRIAPAVVTGNPPIGSRLPVSPSGGHGQTLRRCA